MNKIEFNHLINKKTFLGLFLFLSWFSLNAQISGTALNYKSEPVPFATALLKKISDSSIVTYTQTNKSGFYQLNVKNKGKYLLSINSLSYTARDTIIIIDDLQNQLIVNFVMEQNEFMNGRLNKMSVITYYFFIMLY